MFQIDKAFNPETTNVYSFYQKPGVGLYIPLYQREYSWDKDNINQLLEDVSQGIFSITENRDEIRFLGTVIAVQVRDKRSIYPLDPQGLPSLIENIIDGQQRLSTIALFSTLLYHQIWRLQQGVPDSVDPDIKSQLDEVCEYWKNKLQKVFSLDLERGTPNRKPKIIRGNQDQWTKDGDIDSNYQSDVANYLANFISYIDAPEGEKQLPKFNKKTRTGSNLRQIARWLDSTVLKAHEKETEDFITAWEILDKIDQDSIWQYQRDELTAIVQKKEVNNKKSVDYILCSLVQLFALSHYLLERCCFTIIQPMNEDWAFDMFQSLNATGTPLTAIETFKPSVVYAVENDSSIGRFQNSIAEKSFDKIDALFTGSKSAARKNSLTKDLLISLALTIEGRKLGSHFSQQRKWLVETFTKSCRNTNEQLDFIRFFGNYAEFYKDIWLEYTGLNGKSITLIDHHPEAELISLYILYLKESNHKMAITILGRFYADVIEGKDQAVTNFIEATKIITRFYTLWRSAQSNAGLDVQYRNFFKRPINKDNEVLTSESNIWLDSPQISLDKLREHFNNALNQEGNNLLDKKIWKYKSSSYLKYNKAKSICKLGLFISAHDTIPDDQAQGVMKSAKANTADYLILRKWVSDDLKTIEHIAPQKNTYGAWDQEFYTEEDLYQSIGNLTLLPVEINSSVSNKGWKSKYIYFQFLSEVDTEKHETLRSKAEQLEVPLQDSTLKLLKNAKFNHHIMPIVAVGDNNNWSVEIVKKRTERILDLIWSHFNEAK